MLADGGAAREAASTCSVPNRFLHRAAAVLAAAAAVALAFFNHEIVAAERLRRRRVAQVSSNGQLRGRGGVLDG